MDGVLDWSDEDILDEVRVWLENAPEEERESLIRWLALH